jgi:hypothetical protein
MFLKPKLKSLILMGTCEEYLLQEHLERMAHCLTISLQMVASQAT